MEAVVNRCDRTRTGTVEFGDICRNSPLSSRSSTVHSSLSGLPLLLFLLSTPSTRLRPRHLCDPDVGVQVT